MSAVLLDRESSAVASCRARVWPWGPLEALYGLEEVRAGSVRRRTHGLPRAFVMRQRRHGLLTTASADRLAVAAGWHPANVWPDWYGALAEDVGTVRA